MGPGSDRASLRWEARVAESRLAQAEELAAAGQVAEARTEARAALAAARAAAHPAASARALLLLGRLEKDSRLLEEALAYFEGLHDDDGADAARVALAEQALRDGRPDAALAWLEPITADPSADPADASAAGRMAVAEVAARLHHLRATALRLAGHHADALAEQRRAGLALTLVPDERLVELRVAVAQQLGDDFARAADYKAAFEAHARAAVLARHVEDRGAELAAICGLSEDLAGLGRLQDATDQCQRAVALAQEVGDDERAQALARRGMQWLAELREPPASLRWQPFRAAAR